MRCGTGILAASAWLAATAATAHAAPVEYRVGPVVGRDGGLSALQVRLTFAAEPDGETWLTLPDGYGGGKEFWRNVRDLRIEGASAIEAPEPGYRILRTRPGARITVSYSIVSPFDRDPRSDDSREYEPIIRPTWFHVVGSALFARPYESPKIRTSIMAARFTWVGRSNGFAAVSDLEALPGRAPVTLSDVERSVVVGARDLQLAHRGTVRMAVVGAYSFDPASAASLANKILVAETAFWGEQPRPFLVTVVPTYASSKFAKSIGGTGRSAGFATQMTPNATLADLVALFAHENFHTWNAARLGGQGTYGGRGYWFTEGFTDFYAWRLLARAGAITPQQFVDFWNDMLAAYAASPARTATNAQIVEGFWKDPYLQKLPYQRGALLAAIWDARLKAMRAGRGGLDEIMRAQRGAAAADPDRTPAALLFPKIATTLGLDVGAEIARYVEAGEPIELPADTFGPCASVVWREQPSYDRGWDVRATSAALDVVSGLRNDTPAYQAGLRNGMTILERERGRIDDSSVELRLHVRGPEGGVHDIRFRPEGKGRVRLQQLVLTSDAPACRTREAF